MKNWLFHKVTIIVITSLMISTIIVPSLVGDSFKKVTQNNFVISNNYNRATTLYVGGSGPGNYSSIQAAINAALSGDTIFIYDDSSPYIENLFVNKTISIIGENRNTTLINGNNNGDVIYFIGNNGQNILTLREVMIINSGNGPYDAGLELDRAKYCLIENNVFSNDPIGLFLNDSDSTNIYRNRFSLNNKIGINLFLSDGNTIKYNIWENNTLGVYFYNSRNCYIQENDFYHNTVGINISASSTVNQIYDNDFFYNDIGVTIYSNNNNYVLNSFYYDNDYAIILDNSTDTEVNYNECLNNDIGLYLNNANGNEMENNLFLNNDIAGINVVKSKNNLVSKNDLYNNELGINLNDCKDNTITLNECNNGTNGIIILFNESNLISNNECNNNTNSGIALSSTIDNTISFNDCINNSIGINIEDSSNLNTLVDNFCSNSMNGVLVTSSNNNLIENNIFTENEYGAIIFSSSANEIELNDFSNNVNAVYIDNSNNITIGNNTISDNIDSGVILDISSDNLVLYNDLINNSVGVNISSSNNNNISRNSLYYGLYGTAILSSSLNQIYLNDYSENYYGIYVYDSFYNIVNSNTLSSNSYSAINLSNSDNNDINSNFVDSNSEGLIVYSSDNNIIYSNTIQDNNIGADLISSSNNFVYNNIFSNIDNVHDNGNNVWNTSKTLGINIIGGGYFGGNYWDNYNGSDLNNDGLGDTYIPYDNSGNITNNGDFLPLVNSPPFIPSNPDPADGEIDVSTNIELSWTGGDPDPADVATYDVYFDTNNPPQVKVSSNQTDNFYPTGQMEPTTRYFWYIVSWDDSGASSTGPVWSFTTSDNLPPDIPVISGRKIGKPGATYSYAFLSIDPDGDDLYYNIFWGDGSFEDWIGPYKSDEVVKVEHTWLYKGSYKIMARVRDANGAISDWATYSIIMPRSRSTFDVIILNLLERLSQRFPLIWNLLYNINYS